MKDSTDLEDQEEASASKCDTAKKEAVTDTPQIGKEAMSLNCSKGNIG